ncbi:MAG: NUDIX hydrolase [Bacteroidota bacterium]
MKRETLYSGKMVDLVVDQVRYPSGKTGVREIVRHPGGSAVVPLLDDGTVLFVRQLRYPLEKEILELPAGKLEPGEDPREAASRELEEETGYTVGRLQKLSSIYTSPGFCDEELHIFLATGLVRSVGGPRREEGEFSMTTQTVSLPEALAMIERGEIQDGKTIVGLLLTAGRLRTEGRGGMPG